MIPNNQTESDKKPAATPLLLAVLKKVIFVFNYLAMTISMILMLLASFALTCSIFLRFYFNSATDWQDEAAVLMLVSVVFLCSAYVQSYRGHIGIDVLDLVLSESTKKVHLFFVDILSFLFCTFFSWKCWSMLIEAAVEGHITASTWGAPLTIPYSCMAIGMTALSLQLFIQILEYIYSEKGSP